MAITPEQALFLLDSSLPACENEHRTTLTVLKSVPAGQADYKPHPDAMSAFDLAWHIASSELFFLASLPGGEFQRSGFAKPAALSEIVDIYVSGFEKALAAIRGMSGEQLAKTMDFMGVFQLPAVAYIDFSTRHAVHHRGQLSVYLRPMGAKVPAIYGESYDSKQARLAATPN